MTAFGVEYKVRELVSKILCQILYAEPDIYNYRLEEERIMQIHDHQERLNRQDKNRHCRPDFEIMIKDEDVSQLIVEVKRITDDSK